MLAEPEWSAAALEPEVPDEDDPEGLDECATLAGEEDGAEEDEAEDEEDAGADEEDDELALAELVEDGDEEEDEVAGEEDGDEDDVEDDDDELALAELAEDGDEEREEDEEADAEGADMVAGAEKPPPGCPAAAALEPREREDRTKAAQIKTGAFLMASSPVESSFAARSATR